MKNNKLSPEYRRIPHFNKEISKMTHDDIELETPIQFPFNAYVSEKVDAANVGIAWFDDAPVVRNRKHILNKGYYHRNVPGESFIYISICIYMLSE